MRSKLIKTTIAISFIAIFSPQIAFATTSASFNCSSNLVVSLDSGYSASCEGDFLVNDDALQNDTSISLTAGGLLNIGANASLNAPFISLNSNDVLLRGILNAPSGNIVISSTNSTIIASGAQTNVAGNLIIQTVPKAIVDWSLLNIESSGSLNLRTDASIITLNSISNKAGNTLVSGNVVPSSGGSIVPSNINGVILQTAGTLTLGNNFSAVLDTSPALLVSNVPEPPIYFMLLLGLFGLVFVVKARQIG